MDAKKYLQIQNIISSMLTALPELSSEEWTELVKTNSFLSNIYMLGKYDQQQEDEILIRKTLEDQKECFINKSCKYLENIIVDRYTTNDGVDFDNSFFNDFRRYMKK